MLRTYLQRIQQDRGCLLIWRDRTAWGLCSGSRREDCQPRRGNSPVLTWLEELMTVRVPSVWGTVLAWVKGGLLIWARHQQGRIEIKIVFNNRKSQISDLMQKEDKSAKPDFYSIDELSPLSTPASSPPSSPRNSRSSSPILSLPRAQSPVAQRSPIRPDSPLLCPHKLSPALSRARSFNKDLRRAASFRAARERESLSRNNSPAGSRSG